jgi:hypothetical protein
VPNLSVVLSGSISITDTTLSPSPTIVSRSLNNPSFAATTDYANSFFVSPGAVTLPAATIFVAYVKNLNATGNITVTWTPVGGAPQSFILLPGCLFIYFLTAGTGGGITALSLAGTGNADVYVAA